MARVGHHKRGEHGDRGCRGRLRGGLVVGAATLLRNRDSHLPHEKSGHIVTVRVKAGRLAVLVWPPPQAFALSAQLCGLLLPFHSGSAPTAAPPWARAAELDTTVRVRGSPAMLRGGRWALLWFMGRARCDGTV